MKRLTLAGRLIITALILAALYFGYTYLGGQKALESVANNASTESPEGSSDYKTPEPTSTSNPDNVASDVAGSSFDFDAPEPINGALKGVVELGASGFNSFIINVDPQKRWKLAKAEFGNSLVTENMATDADIRMGLKRYIGSMLDYGVNGKNIHFVVSSGAAKADVTSKITAALQSLGYKVNQVTPQQEGTLALKSVLPELYDERAFVTDIGSGNTKISWIENGSVRAIDTYGAKYFQENVADEKVYAEVLAKAKQIPTNRRKTCFIIGGVPFEMAKEVRKGKERYTVLSGPAAYKLENAKSKAGINIYKAIADATGTDQFVFDWDANFTIGFLLGLP